MAIIWTDGCISGQRRQAIYVHSMWRMMLTLSATCVAARASQAMGILRNTEIQTRGPNLVATNSSSFECNTYTSCTQCVNSSSPCDWCVDGHRCTHDTSQSCRNDILVTGVNRKGPSYRSGPSFCPTINSTFDGTNEILVPFGVKKAIKVKVHIIGQFIVQTRFVCQFTIEGRVTHVNAQLLADTIYCDHVELTYTSHAPNMTALFDVIWGGSKSLDNPDNIYILIYKCNDMADNYDTCIELPEKFGCGWCHSSNHCEIQKQCEAPSDWLNRTETRPNTEFHFQKPALIATNSSSFECNAYTSCTQCVSSPSPCDWCVDGHRCTHDTSQNCRNDILVTGVSRKGPSYRSGPSFCPTINSTFDGTNEILVPFGVKKAIKVKVHIIGQFIVQTRFVCQFIIEGRVTHVNAQLLADTIYCDHVELTYSSHAPNMTASFDVIWGGSKSLDNPDNIHVLIYKCNDMADNYDTCIELPEKFGCGWCHSSNHCEIQKQCEAPSDWLNRTETRPNTEFHFQKPALIATNSSSFECNAYTSCTQCVSSPSPCDWCVDGHRCTHDTSQNCRNDILVTGVSRKGPSYRSGPSFCPTINSTFDGTNEILVPFGVKKAIKVKVHIIGQFIVQTRFVCQFIIEGRVTHVNAQLLADTIYCDHVELTYSSHAPNMTASFDVIWGGSKSLDNPDNIHVLIYKCNDMADNYDTCIELPEKFGCGWCHSSNHCEIQKQCEAPSDWLNRTETRPNTEFHFQKPALIATNSSSFECNAYTSCTQCVSSPSPCDWCVDGHRCTHDTSQNCRNDILVTGVSRKGPSYRSGPSFCPTINSTFDGTNEILVPFGVKKAIKVKVHIIGQFIVQTRFVCQFIIEGRVTHVNAQLLADTIYCDHVELTYSSHAPNMTASFDVIWGGSKSLDNPDNIHVLIYKCNDMADNYDTCIELPEKFGCGWCYSSNHCEIQKQCEAPSDWLNRTETRPNTEFHFQKPALIATNSSSFECNAYTSCTQCVSSPSPCDWCVDGHRCTHDTSQNCRNDILVTGVSRKGPSYRSGPSFCPTINSTFDGTNEILVPFGVKKAIKVKVHIIGQFIVQTRFVCQFIIEGRVTHVNAQLLADTIYCDHVELTYSSHAPNMTASFDVIWGGSKSLDNPDNIHVLIYKCNDMADNYDTCIELPEKFGCGWCYSSNHCEIQKQCEAPSDWLNRTETRPNTEFHFQKPALIATNSSSFECNAYTSCTQCVSSPSPCDWCVDGHRCTHDTSQNCRNDILVTGVSRKGPSYRSGPSFCPTINSTFDGTNEILVPFGVKKAIQVKVHIIGQFIVQTRFVCQFIIEGRVTHVNAQLLADTIYCDHVELTYSSHAPNMTASFDVIWGGSKSLDNPDNIHVLIYKCNDMADNYDTCIELPEKFGCGWCYSSNHCEIQKQCEAPSDWLNRTESRPNTEFHFQKPTLIATNSSSFECNAYTSCTQCVSSPSPCDWCVDGHRCTHDTSQNCRNDILVTGVSRKGPSYRSGPSFCPTINSTFDGTNEILVPFGVKKAIKVKVHIIGQFIVQTRFVCQFIIEGRVTHVNAQLLADTIYCDPVELTYSSHAPNMTASFDVIWGGSKSLDNPDNIHVLIYKCNDMPDNCGNCLERPEKFGCNPHTE